jgi:hypothetical protein
MRTRLRLEPDMIHSASPRRSLGRGATRAGDPGGDSVRRRSFARATDGSLRVKVGQVVGPCGRRKGRCVTQIHIDEHRYTRIFFRLRIECLHGGCPRLCESYVFSKRKSFNTDERGYTRIFSLVAESVPPPRMSVASPIVSMTRIEIAPPGHQVNDRFPGNWNRTAHLCVSALICVYLCSFFT